ncbi:MAG: hypothetical protein KIT42_08365 [Rhodocyclaceae bacterium]|nr:hypothetical protein [Rhodocyclaceae bacterium]
MNATPQRGSRVHTQKRAPSLDLVRLVQLLEKSIKADPTAVGKPASWPLFDLDVELNRLRVNTRGALARLWGLDEFNTDFQPGTDSGFLRDVSQPGRSVDAKVGGRVLEDNLSELSHAISKLREVLKEELSGFLNNNPLKLEQLIARDGAAHLSALAKAVDTTFSRASGKASMVPLQFTDPERSAGDRTDDVARLIAAVEEVESSDWLDKFEGPARRKLVRRGLDEDDIDGAIDNVKREALRLDSQVVRFLNFLDDEALARVRLQVTFAIMGALKEATRTRNDTGAKLLVRYVENVEAIHQHFCDTEHVWSFDLSSAYGMGGKVNVSDSLRMAGHYGCLPVWAEWVAQMFEFRPIGAGSLAREVSYRFRINGDNPQERKSAFLSRLSNIQKDVTKAADDEVSPGVISRSLAQLAFLAIVVPCKEDLARPANPVEEAEKLANEFKTRGQVAVQRLLETLKNRNDDINLIADALIQTLKTKGKALVGAAEKLIRQQHVCVQEDVVDWPRLASASGASQDFFIRPSEAGQSEHPLWFKHLMVTDNLSKVPGLLFSVRVRTRLRERSLAKAGNTTSVTLQRNYSVPAMQIAWRPCEAIKDESGNWVWRRPVAGLGAWLSKGGVDIEFTEASIGRKGHLKEVSPEEQRQVHAANATAFAVLSYMALWLLREMLGEADDSFEALHLLMLRFQTEGRLIQSESDRSISGSEIAYTVSQAVEQALSTESPAYMQGMVLGAPDRFRTGGTFSALCSAFPIHVGMTSTPSVEKIGLVSYATRPCDFHPAYPAADRFLYLAKSYIAEATLQPSPGYLLREDRTQTHLQSKEEFEEPSLILEEIGRLHELGCRHIMLLWHHYGNRHIGRAADRHSPHSRPEFLSSVADRFPDVTLYPLRRDVFPATRIRGRSTSETAFEVLRVREHEEFWHPVENEVRKDYIPFYTFATLGYVAKDDTSKPQSGFCTYFLEADSRLRQVEWAERARVNLIDPNQDSAVRPCLVSVLRGLHFLHAERAVGKPVLDPYDWINPATIGGAGEFKVVTSRRKGGIVLSLPAVLTHVATVLRGGKK